MSLSDTILQDGSLALERICRYKNNLIYCDLNKFSGIQRKLEQRERRLGQRRLGVQWRIHS